MKLSSDRNNLLFPTPVGKSYMCNESDIVLYSRGVSANFNSLPLILTSQPQFECVLEVLRNEMNNFFDRMEVEVIMLDIQRF